MDSDLEMRRHLEIGSITAEAMYKCPPQHRYQLEPYFQVLATKAVRENSDRYIQLIQFMLDKARADDRQQLIAITQDLDLLRTETINAFNAVGDRIESLDYRLQRLKNQPQPRQSTNININFDNTSNAIMWVIIGTLIIGTVGTLLTPVVDYQYQQKIEVKQP